MPDEGALTLSTQDLVIVVSVGLIGLGFILWLLFSASGRRPMVETLTDGAVLMIADGMVQQMSDPARALLGPCENMPVIRVLDAFLGEDATEARDAVNRLEMTGDPVDMLVHTPDGQAYELIGTPSGALIRLVLRDAHLMDVRLRDAEERVSAAAEALQQRKWEHETLGALINDAPLIAWHRTADGSINWSGGRIVVRNSSVLASRAVELIVARTQLNRQPVLAGQPQKSRIEIVVDDSAETLSLHVVEIIRQDGTRIGFATDAGTAASAERTLTRFVQTMTETFAHLTVGLAIFDRNQTLALFNPALVQMWQVEPAWLARRPSLRDIIDELRASRRLPELQDFHKWRSRLLGLFENTEAADYEELWHLADGSNIRVLARPHPHGSLAFIFDDVTERVRLEQRYRHSIDLRRATLDRLTEGIAVFGPNGLLQFVNQAFHEIWGTDSETVYAAMHARQIVGLCEDLTVTGDVWQRLYSFITGAENRQAWEAELEMGSGRVLITRVAPLPDGSTMAVFSDAVPQPSTLPPPGRDGEVDPGAAPAVEGPVTQGSAPTQGAPTDLAALLHETAHRLAPTAAAAEVSVRAVVPPQGIDLPGDPRDLSQVAFVLLTEVIRSAAPGAEIALEASGTDEAFTLSVVTAQAAADVEPYDTMLAAAQRFAGRDGGVVSAEPDTAVGALHLSCRYDAAARREIVDETVTDLSSFASKAVR